MWYLYYVEFYFIALLVHQVSRVGTRTLLRSCADAINRVPTKGDMFSDSGGGAEYEVARSSIVVGAEYEVACSQTVLRGEDEGWCVL